MPSVAEIRNEPNWQAANNERKYSIKKGLLRSANIRQKNKPNLLFKNLIFERKIDDTKLYKICKTNPI